MTSKRAHQSSAFTLPLLVWVVAFVLVVAVLAGQPALLTLCALLLALIAGANAWSRYSLAQLRCTLRVDRQRLFPDESLTLGVDVENTRFLPVWLQISVPLPLRAAPPSADTALLPFQRASFAWSVAPGVRGVHRLGPIELEAADPLGFFPKKRLANTCEILVYPRLVPLQPVALPKRDFFDNASAHSPVRDPTLIQGVRDYQYGHSARTIHWKVSARHNRVIEKVCEVVEHESVLLLVDVASFEHAAAESDDARQAFESCLEVIASLGAQLDRLRYAFGLQTDGRRQDGVRATLKLARSPGQLIALLEVLARLELRATGEALSELIRSEQLPHGVSIMSFGYGLDASSSGVWQVLRKRSVSSLAVECCPDAKSAPAVSMHVRRLDELTHRAGQEVRP